MITSILQLRNLDKLKDFTKNTQDSHLGHQSLKAVLTTEQRDE